MRFARRRRRLFHVAVHGECEVDGGELSCMYKDIFSAFNEPHEKGEDIENEEMMDIGK